jgi:hypothetical protein
VKYTPQGVDLPGYLLQAKGARARLVEDHIELWLPQGGIASAVLNLPPGQYRVEIDADCPVMMQASPGALEGGVLTVDPSRTEVDFSIAARDARPVLLRRLRLVRR